MKNTTRILSAAASALLALPSAGTIAHADTNSDTAPEGPLGPLSDRNPFAKDASQLSWGNKNIPTGSQIRHEMKDGKRPSCTVNLKDNKASAKCVNNTNTHYYAIITTTCPVKDQNGRTTYKPANSPFAIPAHRSGGATARCAAGTKANGINLIGPLTREEVELIQKSEDNQKEFTIKTFL